MRKILLLAVLALCALPLQAQQNLAQSFIVTAAGAPPTVTVGQSFSTSTTTGASTSLTGGTVAAGTFRICVTFFSTANTETPCSVDTAATSVITTTGATSTVTVFPPIPTGGVGSVAGWRVYIGASAGAAGAETLQTINATICTLSATPTASCSLNSSATFTSSAGFVGGGGGPASPGTLLTYPNSNAVNMTLFENSNYVTQILSWIVTGTAPGACTVQLQAGTAPGTLANVGQSLTCTATGSYALPSVVSAAYVAPNITAFTAGGVTTSVTFTITAVVYPLAFYWGPAAPTSACTAGTGFFTNVGTTTATLFSCAAGAWTAVTLP
jgi:hypothetical protein